MYLDNYLKTIFTILNFLSNQKINFDIYLNNPEDLSIEEFSMDSSIESNILYLKKHNLKAFILKYFNKNKIIEVSFSIKNFQFITKDQICLNLNNDLKITLTKKEISLSILYIFDNSNYNFRFIYNFDKNLKNYNLEIFKVCKQTFKIQDSNIEYFNSYVLNEIFKHNLEYEKIIPNYNFTTVLNFKDPLIKNQLSLLDLINYN